MTIHNFTNKIQHTSSLTDADYKVNTNIHYVEYKNALLINKRRFIKW